MNGPQCSIRCAQVKMNARSIRGTKAHVPQCAILFRSTVLKLRERR